MIDSTEQEQEQPEQHLHTFETTIAPVCDVCHRSIVDLFSEVHQEQQGILQEMQDLGESNAQLLADNTQMRALLVGWYGLWSMRDWRAGADALADATQVFVNER